MPAILTGSGVQFGDNTSQTTAFSGVVNWSGISGRPTDLGSFSNGPGYTNGGGGQTSYNCGGYANCGWNGVPVYVQQIVLYRSGNNYVVNIANCNCYCC